MGTPDVCLTPAPPAPPVPIPYPNIAMVAQATGTATKVKFASALVVIENSQIPQSQGDEAGVNGGVMSGVNMQVCTFKMGSSVVSVEGKACCMLTSTVGHNGSSANQPGGAQIAPSQALVLVAQ